MSEQNNNQNEQQPYAQPVYQQPQGPVKQCKFCKVMIPANAKVCPNCKKNQKNKVVFWIVLVVVVLLLFSCVSALGGSDNSTPAVVDTSEKASSNVDAKTEASSVEEQVEASSVEERTEFAVGETVDLNGIEATLASVEESTGDEFIKPADGNVFVLLQFEIANNSSSDITVSSMLSFEAYCDDYAVNQNFISATDNKPTLDGSVAAGKKMNGFISYEVPTDWKEMEISFTPDFWSSRDIKFIATK